MRKIPLYSKVQPGLFAMVDDQDYELVSQYRWRANRANSDRGNWYAQIRGHSDYPRGTLMHTVITTFPLVDHEDGNGLNNQRHNLRDATQQENTRNRSKMVPPTSSQYKGVCWDKERNKWVAHIDIGEGRKRKLGRFTVERDAAVAYNKAAIEIFGEYALVNEIGDG